MKMEISDHQAKESRLMTVISAISRHYFDQFNIDISIKFWKLLEKKDFLLRIILSLYRSPFPITVIALVVLALLSLFPGYTLFNSALLIALSISILVIFSICVIFGVIIILHFVKRGIPYIELIFHPFSVANLVGLSMISIADESWIIGTKISPRYLFPFCFFLYCMAFMYIHADVYKVLRLKQNPKIEGQSIKKNATMTRSIKISRNLFFTQVLQTLIVSSFSSILLAESFLSSCQIDQLQQEGTGIEFEVLNCNIILIPKLIVLWTGLILFIGAFVQLFWQGKERSSKEGA